ncbi:unknown [Acidaminococcus intestini CAG:325]|nr:unknown [Acidaminococcus intestini CAG:325]
MPSNGFPFAVRVRCKIYLVRFFGKGLQFFDEVTFSTDVDVLRLKIMIHVHTELAFGKITQVTHGGLDSIVFSQETTDSF